MIAFAIVAAVLVGVALLFVVPPLLGARRGARSATRDAVNIAVYRDQLRELDADLEAGTLSRDRYDEARREIERRLLEDAGAEAAAPAVPVARSRAAAAIVGVVVPLLAGALYLLTGTPAALNPGRLAAEEAHGFDRRQIEAMVEELAQKLRASPDPNPEGWLMLGRSYNAMGRYAEAVDAYRHALKAGPPDARLLADYADALAMAQGRTLAGEPEQLVQQALKLDPNNVKALALAGTAAFDRKDYRSAVDYWERIRQVVPAESEMGRSVAESIAEARSLGGIAADAKPNAQAKAAAGSGRVSGQVRIAPSLAARISPNDTVFIYAQAVEGPSMPLAILRRQAADLPLHFSLDDSMAMTPQTKLSAYPRVVVRARVSKSGNAMPQPGDLEGRTQPIEVGAADAVVLIDRVLP